MIAAVKIRSQAAPDGSWRIRSEQDAGACPVRPLIGHAQVYATRTSKDARANFVRPRTRRRDDAPQALFADVAR